MGPHFRHCDALRLALGVAGIGAIVTGAPSALAEEPRKVTEPSVMNESAEITSVVDAFDGEDPFDLHITLGFQQSWKTSRVRRESNANQVGLSDGGFIRPALNVAEYKERTSRLIPRVDIGLFHDIGLYFRLPVILAHDRELNSLKGSEDQQSFVLQGAPGEQLFTLPHKSPTRSGIEYLALGLDFGLMNQTRNPAKPTWIFGFEGRFNVSTPMRACNDNPTNLNQTIDANGTLQQRKCADPSDINRNGRSGEAQFVDTNINQNLEGNFSGGRSAGVSRGTTALEIHTYLSKRIKYIEPYGGFYAMVEFQTDASDYGQTDLEGSLVNRPPVRGGFVIGTEISPYEVREKYQKLSFDIRLTGTYVSEGRDYSELFDALGSSDAPTIRSPNFAGFQGNADATSEGAFPSVVNPQSQKVYFTGLTDVQQHGMYTLKTGVTFQAGEYVKFAAGTAYTATQGHYITFDQPCNPDFNQSDRGRAGPCQSSSTTGATGTQRVTGIPNPNYRPVINTPGRRFRVDDINAWDVFINATVMF